MQVQFALGYMVLVMYYGELNRLCPEMYQCYTTAVPFHIGVIICSLLLHHTTQ